MTNTQNATQIIPAVGVAPEYIERDSYAGRWTRRGVPAGYRVTVVRASEVAAVAPTGALWESFGHVRGVETFGRGRYVADSAGSLHVYDATGRKIIVHPGARELRVLSV